MANSISVVSCALRSFKASYWHANQQFEASYVIVCDFTPFEALIVIVPGVLKSVATLTVIEVEPPGCSVPFDGLTVTLE
jgi:hypothetical protein